MSATGKVYLVGAGPGDPELLTLKAARLIAAADVIVYDRLVSAEILSLANPSARLVYAGKRQGEQEAIQYAIHHWLLESAQAGKTVVRLKGGDPMVFGRGAEELHFLVEHGIEAEIVPGISSAFSVAALAGIPLTYRGIAASFTVVAGHRQAASKQDWQAFAGVDTLVVLMGVENRQEIARELIAAGRPATQAVAFVECVSTDRERTVESTLSEVASGRGPDVQAPAVWLIGETVRLRTPVRCCSQTVEALA